MQNNSPSAFATPKTKSTHKHAAAIPLRHSIAAIAMALFTASAHAVVLPIAEDSASSANGQMTTNAGKAVTLTVSKTTTSATRAYLDFNVSATGLTASDVAQARLKIYIAAVTTPGALQVAKAGSEWHESTAGVAPAAAGTPVTIPQAAVVKKNFIVVDVTQMVKDSLTTPAGDFGFIIEAPGAKTKVMLGAKEGAAVGYPAELEIDLTPDVGQIGAANLDPAFVATLPTLAQANTFTATNTFTFGSGARTVSIQDDSSGKAPVINVGGTGINAGKLRLRNALHVFPSDDGSRGSEILLHDAAGTSTIALFGSNGSISAGGIDTTILGIGGANARADFTFFNGGPSKLLSIKGGADQTPEIVVNDGGTGILRVRNRLEVWPNEAGTTAGTLNIRDASGSVTISGDGLTGQLQAVRLVASSVSVGTALDTDTLLATTSTTSKKYVVQQSAETVGAGGSIPSASGYAKLTAVGGIARTLSASTAIADGTTPGQMLILQGSSDTGTITVPDNANTQLGAATRVLGANDTLTLIWDGVDWIETAFTNN